MGPQNNSFSAGIVFIRQNLTSTDGSRAERVNQLQWFRWGKGDVTIIQTNKGLSTYLKGNMPLTNGNMAFTNGSIERRMFELAR